MHGALSHEQARFFRDQGYYKLLGVFGGKEITEANDFVRDEADSVTVSDSNPNKKIYGLYDRNPELMRRMVGAKAMVGALESLLGPNIVFVKNRHNHATVNNRFGESPEGLHRDILQPTRGLITAVVYLDDATVENGATMVVPGSHNLPFVGVPQENGGGTWMSEHEEFTGLVDQAVPVPMEAGDVLLFNGTLFHGAGHNYSGEPRTSLTFGYRSADELDAAPDVSRQIAVAGQQIYRGNDT